MKNLIYYIFIFSSAALVYFYFSSAENNALSNEVSDYRINQKNTLTQDSIISQTQNLNYFKPSINYRFDARIEKAISNIDTVSFHRSKTNSTLYPAKNIHFTFNNIEIKLTAYKTEDDVYIIPFTDSTNLSSTSKFGRLIPLESIENNFTIDFNLSYNPACEYSTKIDCIETPNSNHIPFYINAGEKRFKP